MAIKLSKNFDKFSLDFSPLFFQTISFKMDEYSYDQKFVGYAQLQSYSKIPQRVFESLPEKTKAFVEKFYCLMNARIDALVTMPENVQPTIICFFYRQHPTLKHLKESKRLATFVKHGLSTFPLSNQDEIDSYNLIKAATDVNLSHAKIYASKYQVSRAIFERMLH